MKSIFHLQKNFVLILFVLFLYHDLCAEGIAKSELVAFRGEQSELRNQKRMSVGGFGIRELSWFQLGYNLGGKFALSFLFHQRQRADRFDLDRIGSQSNAVAFSLQNREAVQNQYSIALEWFPFSIPYFLSIGLGQEFYFQRDRKNEFWVYEDGSSNGKTWSYSISNKRAYLAPGAGIRYVFPTGLFLYGGFSVLLFMNSSAHVQRENIGFYNQTPDLTILERIWKDGKEKELDRANGIGIQLFLSIGISI
ncbi:hypothetical protein AB3N59_15120 [Leptospira sp. WS92.C1]